MHASRLLVLTGDGKGKTTSAAGMLLRAVGHGQRAALVRFVKSRPSGEVAVLERLGVELAGGGHGFLPANKESSAFAQHAAAARVAWDAAEQILSNIEAPALVVLDEICIALGKGLLEEAPVRTRLSSLPPGVSAVCTGRDAPEWLCGLADTVSEVSCQKHAYRQGIPATEGIEL
jgi:cob(I)alamin adenosyltransferase